MTRIEIRVPAVPVAQPRPRATLAHGGQAARMHEVTSIKNAVTGERRPHPIAEYKATVKMAAQAAYQGPPLECPLAADIVCVFAARSKHRRPKPTKPDCDNLAKSTLDALNGLTFRDDGQIVRLTVQKWHAAQDEQPHVEITLEPILASADAVPTTARPPDRRSATLQSHLSNLLGEPESPHK